MAKLKIGVLISGGGSNLQALIDDIAQGTLDAEIVHVISSRPDAYGIIRAQQARIPVEAFTRSLYEDREEADERIVSIMKGSGAEYIVMAGYMRMVTPVILNAFPNRVVNLHPALLPSFKGAHAIQDAWDYGVKVTGVTVHFANEEYDKGPIIAQMPVPVIESDTIDTLEARIHEVEHELLPYVVKLLAEGRVRVTEEGKVLIN